MKYFYFTIATMTKTFEGARFNTLMSLISIMRNHRQLFFSPHYFIIMKFQVHNFQFHISILFFFLGMILALGTLKHV